MSSTVRTSNDSLLNSTQQRVRSRAAYREPPPIHLYVHGPTVPDLQEESL
jgi:hypothetical protein